MIIAKAPLRVSIGGGGTDLPSFYENNNGTIFSSLAIKKYIFVSINEKFNPGFFIRYSSNEKTDFIEDIDHPIIKETLIDLNYNNNNLEITSTSDIPSGTGLGSSGTFGVALQLALRELLNKEKDKEILAKESTKIEMDILKRPIGLQDQYISAYGGITEFKVSTESKVVVNQRKISQKTEDRIKNSLFLIFTSSTRSSSKILSFESKELKKKDNRTSYESIIELGREMFELLTDGRIKEYGHLMHEYWMIKRQRQKSITDKNVNNLYDFLKANEIIYGGKLVGAGGSGFLLVSTGQKKKLLEFTAANRYITFPVEIDNYGAQLVS